MKDFEEYFSDDAIIIYLCKLRAKLANSRNKKHLIHILNGNEKYNYHLNDSLKYKIEDNYNLNGFVRYEKDFIEELNKILPPRKKWINLGLNSRFDIKTNQVISSNKRNEYSLLKTIKSFKKSSKNEAWLIALDNFIKDIQLSISSNSYKIDSPVIFPKLKDEKQLNGKVNICRPICLFNLKDRIVLSITNKYLTKLFDPYFEDCSYAFRSKKNNEGTSVLNHHDCVKEILKYRNQYSDLNLFVTECDMEKFFDTVNHKVVRTLYDELIHKCINENQSYDFSKPSYIFNQFLDCYAFNLNVTALENDKYWKSYDIPNGKFEWVSHKIKDLNYYENINLERIGIPQGGALSGLIANIILNVVDKVMLQTGVFYLRFCDDMIIIHENKNTCEVAKDLYVNTLKGLKLLPHSFKSDSELRSFRMNNSKERRKLGKYTYEPFWNCKSKGPYKWGPIEENGFPWIGFVGYEINYEGLVRVRKKSFFKELKKQKKVVEDIRKITDTGLRKSNGAISESVIHRLVGMSVGRINLRNFETISNDLCWKNGFKLLRYNKYTVQQIKQLDRNRNKLYYDFINWQEKHNFSNLNKLESKPRQIVHFNKPFSYFYQILERENNNDFI